MQRKANAIQYPDWNSPSGIVITRAESENVRPVWREYKDGPWWLRLVVQVEITGGWIIYDPSWSKEEADAKLLECNRQAAWRNARRFAEMLWLDNPYMEYAVFFRPEGESGLREAVCVYVAAPDSLT